MNKFITFNEAMNGLVPSNFIKSIINDLKIKADNIKGFDLEFDTDNNLIGIKICVVPEVKNQKFDCLELLKNCGFTDEQIKGISFKYIENGNVVCDIKDGVDMTKSKCETESECGDLSYSELDDAVVRINRNVYSIPIREDGDVVDMLKINFSYKGKSGKHYKGVSDADLVEMLMNRWEDKRPELSNKFREILNTL